MIITDLNPRERTTYATQLDSMATTATTLATALRDNNDTEALMHLVLLALGGTIVRDLTKVFQDAVPADLPPDISTLTQGTTTP